MRRMGMPTCAVVLCIEEGMEKSRCGSKSASAVQTADEGEVNRLVSGCLSAGCGRKQITKLSGNGKGKNSVAERASKF